MLNDIEIYMYRYNYVLEIYIGIKKKMFKV